MGKFIVGIEEKYPKELLEGRLTVEGNVIGCIYQDPLLIEEYEFESSDFITSDGKFYFSLAKQLRKSGYVVFDEVSILSSCSENVIAAFNERGGYDTIRGITEIISLKNADAYFDTLYRENIMIDMYNDGFNLLSPIWYNNKEVLPYKLFRKLDSEGVLDFYESRLSIYKTGCSSKVLEEDYIDFDDEYFEDMDNGEAVGVPIDTAGEDINKEDMRCLPFISNQIGGFYDGTFNVLAGHSSVGKSAMMTTIITALAHRDRKVLIISNEQKKKVFQDNFLAFILYKHFRYFGLTKKKMRSANLNDEDKKMRAKAQKYWREHYKDRIKFISISDSDMKIVKKKIREAVLIHGFDTVVYDTLKVQIGENVNQQTWLSLVEDSRELDKIAKKYNIIVIASLQLAMNSKGKLFLDGSELSMSKQSIEVMESLMLMRSVYPEELDPKSRYYCNPFRLIKVNDKWVEEPYELDKSQVYKALFLGKTRNGINSNDSGSGYILAFNGNMGIFREVAQARFRHGNINGSSG